MFLAVLICFFITIIISLIIAFFSNRVYDEKQTNEKANYFSYYEEEESQKEKIKNLIEYIENKDNCILNLSQKEIKKFINFSNEHKIIINKINFENFINGDKKTIDSLFTNEQIEKIYQIIKE